MKIGTDMAREQFWIYLPNFSGFELNWLCRTAPRNDSHDFDFLNFPGPEKAFLWQEIIHTLYLYQLSKHRFSSLDDDRDGIIFQSFFLFLKASGSRKIEKIKFMVVIFGSFSAKPIQLKSSEVGQDQLLW